ncbi:RHOD and Cytochrom_C3 domain-containing protein [Campylobacter blaseri]|uniref:Rhodanese domain-containing protein n=1 Tax=Campylobacter blaseri TaxID=2042961 RepID=A0A2P8R055_9BACT|nr:rhodanese-like domain-containing protein [Campylobacter blaseri]PSM51879.1 hypothetical protein CQ405_04755 [Campylobacter blaseri]PSM53663.1 hypothetical protein CRN67_04755 [Campylobacter blaseri]QKF85784.1 RHOD and Cytochrom_C3 domain-containing protein [Campylobacter blaseri]
MNRLLKQMFTTLFLFASLLFFSPAKTHASGEGSMAIVDGVIPISMSQAKGIMENGAHVYDFNMNEVRNEYGFIKGATLVDVDMGIPFDKLEAMMPKDKDATILCYCLNRLCYTSSEAALSIMKMGYKNVYVMLEGIEAWILHGNPVEKKNGSNVPDKYKYVGSNNWAKSESVTDYTDVIHRQIMFGDIPSCRDCHGIQIGYDKKAISENFASNRKNINQNCALCHEEEGEEFSTSAHSFLVSTKENSPMCTDCHDVHMGKETTLVNMKKMSDQKCGSCHEKERKHYHNTFHGKAMYLEDAGKAIDVAACYDCHGAHNIYKIDDKRSTLHPGANRIETCASCHPGGGENFSNWIAHADHTDPDNTMLYSAFIFMTGLIAVVFGFFFIHTALWTMRLLITRAKYPKEWKEAKEKAHSDPVKIERFTNFHKIQHFFLAASFLGLGFSGLPQKFYTASWAQDMIAIMGGPMGAIKIHHISAIIMIIVFLSHIAEFTLHGWRNRKAIIDPATGKYSFKIFLGKLFGPDSLMPNFQDFRDLKENFLWFIGKRETMPKFDRWTYWEKFDWIAVFWGMFIIGLSGLMLWFPVWFTKFLPGELLNLATFLHSDEALLALGFIFLFHFFHTHFRANKFPMDMVIFSGHLTEEELKQEREPWYNRLKESGKLEELKVKNDNFNAWKTFSYFIGYAMVITGFIFLFMMIYAFIEAM